MFSGKSYFFKGTGFWKFDDSIMHVAHNRPKSSAIHWMGCPRTHHDIEDIPTEKAPLKSDSGSMKFVAILLLPLCIFSASISLKFQ